MSKRILYRPYNYVMLAFLIGLLVLVASLLFVGFVGLAFRRIGFSPQTTILILVATFVGSYINIPLLKVKTVIPVIREEYVSFFGVVFRIPQIECEEFSTTIALNVGGALIPVTVSVYLLWRFPSALPYALVGTIMVAFITHLVARPVKGLGIATPAFIPPIAAALMAYVLPFTTPAVIAYTSGVLGTLIGADLTNLHKISSLGAKIASIGGAGTFDGIFLSGIISTLLV